MKRENKNLLIVVLAAAILQLFTILYYEQKQNLVTELAAAKLAAAEPAAAGSLETSEATISNDSALALIKSATFYQGDSIWIDEEERVRSNDKYINSTIEQMYVVEDNLKGIVAQASRDRLPVHYVVYKTAIGYYLEIYKNKSAEQKTSTH